MEQENHNEPARQDPEQMTFAEAPRMAVDPEIDPDVAKRAAYLSGQADTLRQATGVDMIAVMNQNEDMRRSILSGAWDFADAYRSMRAAPPAVRDSGSGASAGFSIRDMTPGEFARLNDKLRAGGTVTL